MQERNRLKPKIQICRWKYNAPFAYSLTYDEGTIEVLANALPIHEQFNFPGHLDVVVGQLGEQRHAYGSTLNGYFHMNPERLKFLISKGWGVGNHSWSHFVYPCQPGLDLFREVVWSKYRLEEMLDYPIRIFAIPNDTYNYEPIIDIVKKYYLACINIEGSPNRGDFDLFDIGNYVLGSGKIPTRPGWPKELKTQNLTLNFLADSWLYETTHLVRWNVPQPNKNVTPEYLVERFKKLFDISGGKLWAAKPDDVIDYELMRRNLSIENIRCKDKTLFFDIEGKWPVGVVNSFLTVKISNVKFREIMRIEKEYKENIPDALREKPDLQKNIEKIEQEDKDWSITLQLVPGEPVKVTFG